MTEADIIELAGLYVEEGYDPVVAEAFVRAGRDLPSRERILRQGFTPDEDSNVLEPQRKRNRKADAEAEGWNL